MQWTLHTYEMKKLLILSLLTSCGIFLCVYTEGAVCRIQGMFIAATCIHFAE